MPAKRSVIMREIKFRALAVVNDKHNNIKVGDFVYGQYIESGCDAPCIIFGDGDQIEVDKKTLGQFINIKDKKGEEVFEGDVMSPIHYQEVAFGNAVVGYKKCMFCFEINKPFISKIKPITESFSHGAKANNHFIVIGNIHQNPELMEQN